MPQAATHDTRHVYLPEPGRPMHVVAFASGSGGNFAAALDLSDERPDLLRVGLLVTDRPGIGAIDIARQRGVPVLMRDFAAEVAPRRPPLAHWAERQSYDAMARAFHDRILTEIERHEVESGLSFDIVLLAYRRLIQGELLKRFADRIINQHPADLALLGTDGRRLYTGIPGLRRSLTDGHRSTRTSTILINEGEDAGEILCRGPSVKFSQDSITAANVDRHEQRQKKYSDWPALRFVLRSLAEGRYTLHPDERHPDGCRVVALDGRRLGYGGVEMEAADMDMSDAVPVNLSDQRGDPETGAPATRETDVRPWGRYEVLEEGTGFKVKRIDVLPGKRLSYQRHASRAEHWFVTSGEALVTLDGKQQKLSAGEAIDVPRGAAHRVQNDGPGTLTFIEVQTGDYLGEDDIVRLDDDYGRA